MDQVDTVSTDQLTDLGVIMLDHSVKQQSSHVHIHPWKFAAGIEVIWIAVEQNSNRWCENVAAQKTTIKDIQGNTNIEVIICITVCKCIRKLNTSNNYLKTWIQ